MSDHYVPPPTGVPVRTDEEEDSLLRDLLGNIPRPVNIGDTNDYLDGLVAPPAAPTPPAFNSNHPDAGSRFYTPGSDLYSPSYAQQRSVLGVPGAENAVFPGEFAPRSETHPTGPSNAGGISEFDQALLRSVGYTPGTPGGPSRQVTDQAAVQAQQSAIQETLDATLAQIADQFQVMQTELDRQRETGLDEIEKARTQALESLTGLREDFNTQSGRVDAQILQSVGRTSGGIRSGADSVLRDLEAQGASTAGVQRAVSEGVAQSENQGQIQGNLVDRLQEINSQFVQRNEQTTGNIAQGASSDLQGGFAQLVAGLTSERSSNEFSANEQARQSLLQLALNPPKKTVGGGGGTAASGVLSETDTLLLQIAMQQGQDGTTALADILEGRPLFDPLPEQNPTVDSVLQDTILGNPEVLEQVIGAELARMLDVG